MNGQIITCTMPEYLAIDAESSGRCEDFNERPALYHAKHIAKTVTQDATAAMVLGSAIHCRVLEGADEFAAHYAVGPCDDKRLKQWLQWERDQPPGKTLLRPSQYDVIDACFEAIRRHDAACDLLFGWDGFAERSGMWTDDTTGLACKLRFDRDVTEKLAIAELKTARSALPDDVQRAAVTNGYHVRGAWYVDGYREIYGQIPNAMVFVTVDTELDPKILEDRVYVWTLEPALEELGARIVRSALDGIAACRASGVWRAGWSQGVHMVHTPRWMQSQL